MMMINDYAAAAAAAAAAQARSCLYASTQLNPHYFDKKNFFSKKMWFEIQLRSPDLIISTLNTL